MGSDGFEVVKIEGRWDGDGVGKSKIVDGFFLDTFDRGEGTNVDAVIEREEVCDESLISLFFFVITGAFDVDAINVCMATVSGCG